MQGDLPLAGSLAYVDALLERARPQWTGARAFGAADAFVDLPDFQGGLGATIDAASLRTLASLYFLAELEETYLIATAEELSRHRFSLNLSDFEAAQKLEELARAMDNEWIDIALRGQIFGRVFGIGQAPSHLPTASEFEPRFAQFADTLRRASSMIRWGAAGSDAARAGVAANALMSALAPRVQGNTLLVTERLSNQLKLALGALNHRGLASLFQGHTAWDVIRGVMGADVPDLEAHVTRAQTGLRLLSWAATALDALRSANVPAITQAIQAEPQLQGWAEMWLEASGLTQQPPPQSQPTHPAPGWLQ